MNKQANHLPRGVTLLLALLCCILIQAQPKIEYWFDGNYSDKQSIYVGATTCDVIYDIDVNNLSQGYHTICMHFVGASSRVHSPITSSTFFKYTAGSDHVLEYWFDEGEKRRLSTPINIETDEMQTLMLDLSDIERFPLGVHRLNIRVAARGSNYSPVYTSYVLRMPEGSGDAVLEYWLDDDLDNRCNKSISIANDKPQIFDLDMSTFPIGFHKLSMRIAAGSSHSSQIYTSHILRLPIAKESGRLIYWLDDDYANRRSVPTTRASLFSSEIFADLQFPSASMGMHRLHWRASRGGLDGPIEDTPVLITKKYNSRGSVHLTNQSIWLDDNNPSVSTLNSVESIIVKNYYLNPNDFADGQHTFYMMYQNSADVWSEQNVTYFYKEPSTGMLRIGIMPDIEDGIDEASTSELMSCVYHNGALFVDCQSSRLASEGLIVIYDLTGRVLIQEKVKNDNGIHAEVNVPGKASQVLVVKFVSGSVVFTKKLVGR